MKSFGGPVLFLDRADINTDEIIPARYLTEISKEALAPHLLEDLKLEGFDPRGEHLRKARVIVSRGNFGCGSSREHAPWALEVNGITAVMAPSFARIFRQNIYNCGMLALELRKDQIDQLFNLGERAGVTVTADFQRRQLVAGNGEETLLLPYQMDPFARALVEAGGWVEFADARY